MIERRAVAQSLGRYLEDSQEDTLVHLCTRAAPARGCTPLEGLGLLGEKMQDHLRAAASQEPIVDAGEATQASKRRRLQQMGFSVQVLGNAGRESSQDSLAPPVPLSTQDVENYEPSPDLDAPLAAPEYDEGEESERDAAASDGEKEPLWSPTTEPANSQELARLGRAKEVKAEAPEEVPAPLQLVKVEKGAAGGFAASSEVSLHGGMISLMGEMLQQQAEYHARCLAQQQQQNDRMYELCKAVLSQSREAAAPCGSSANVKFEDDVLAYKPVLLVARPGQVGLLKLLYGLDD